ncbi:uncharacterized protein METZ01_LOCUS272781 [marine metagenome]|uniref:Uncharacterized protein n=1 Tax=marine metagenome TaxID=408172 RepID=A0A382KA61_9ZZZZ
MKSHKFSRAAKFSSSLPYWFQRRFTFKISIILAHNEQFNLKNMYEQFNLKNMYSKN